MAGRGTDIILGGNHSQMAQLNVRARLSEILLPLEEQAKIAAVGDEFYPIDIPEELEVRLEAAVEGIAATEKGEATETFLKLEELALIAGEAPFEEGPSVAALVELRESYGQLKQLFKDALADERDKVKIGRASCRERV